MNIKMKLLNTLFIFTLVAACGGGGGGSSETPATPTTTAPTTTAPTTTIDDEFGAWLTDVSNNVIIPGYMAMHEQGQALALAGNTFCSLATPANDDLTTLKNSWAKFNQNWQYIQWVKVGPVVEDSRLFRVQLWPDSNDAVSRNVGNALLEPNELTAEFISGQPVGAQGIPALELLLFATGEQSLMTADDKAKRCEAVVAITKNLSNISTSLYQGWLSTDGNYIEQVISGTGDFTSQKDAVEELVTNWLEQVERVKDEKMLEPLAINAPGIPSIIEFTMSEQSLPSIKTNLRSFKDLFTTIDGHGFDNILTDHLEQQAISEDMVAKLDAAISTAALLDGNYVDLLNDDDARATLTELIQNVREIRDLVTTEFVQVTDINIGFNSNDGD